jgi:D-glycero-alpha-D-manno-heptose-7-phosphate kinase
VILARAPFRVTLGGGGTDLPSYYGRYGGFILAMGLDKYMYVAVNAPVIGRLIRVHYTKSEAVAHPDALQHELAREALKRHGIFSQIEISSMADLPAGTGLGSSSSYLVALLSALRAYNRNQCSPQTLAEEACDIELNVLNKPIGKQDQYLAAFGGVTVLEIGRDGKVRVRAAKLNPSSLSDFLANTQLWYTGVQRSAPDILSGQDAAMRAEQAPAHEAVHASLQAIQEIGYSILEAIEGENYDEFGRLMDRHWEWKQKMSSRIAVPGIDQTYAELRQRFGVLGGKVSGAGGGGFFMIYAPRKHREVGAFLAERGLVRMHYGIEFDGSKIISNSASFSTGFCDHAPIPEAERDRLGH